MLQPKRTKLIKFTKAATVVSRAVLEISFGTYGLKQLVVVVLALVKLKRHVVQCRAVNVKVKSGFVYSQINQLLKNH